MSGFRSDVSIPVRDSIQFDFGYDYSHDVYRSDRVQDDEMSRDEHGFFIQSEIQPWQRLTVLLGGRYDMFSTIDNHFSPRISVLYSLTTDLKLRGSWGGGFRAPSFLDMYIDYQNPYITVVGNPDLEPEASTGSSLGMDWTYGDRLQTTLNVSQSKVDNLITDVVIGRQLLSYDNVEEATFTSLEWQNRIYVTRNLNVLLGYNYTDIDHSDSELASSVTPHAGTIRATWSFWNRTLNLSVRQQLYSARDVNVFDTQLGDYRLDKKKGYGLLDITLTAKVHRLLTARAGLTNALDFVDEEFGPWIGRRFFVSLNSRFPSF
jgi:outer membrane receptor for ferrienterochelin and colicins